MLYTDEMAMTMMAIVFEWSSQGVEGEVEGEVEVEVVALDLQEADMAPRPGAPSTGS